MTFVCTEQYEVAACRWSTDTAIRECSTLTCPTDQYRYGCGGGSKGQCNKCQPCGDGRFRVNCGGENEGTCHVCAEGTYSIGTALTCSVCRAACSQVDALEYQSANCSGVGDRKCSPCSSLALCPSGYYRSACAAQSAGICTLCLPCPAGQQRQGCSALSAGVCTSCPPDSFNIDAVNETRAPITFVEWRVRAATTSLSSSSTSWTIRQLSMRDLDGVKLMSPYVSAGVQGGEGGSAISSGVMGTRNVEDVVGEQSSFVRLGRVNGSDPFVGWAFAHTTAVAHVDITRDLNDDQGGSNIVIEGRNRADFTHRLLGACVDRARMSPRTPMTLLKSFAADIAVEQQAHECLHLCQVALLPDVLTGCQLEAHVACYAHTDSQVTQADGEEVQYETVQYSKYCWLATPRQWHLVLRADSTLTETVVHTFSAEKETHTFSIATHTQQHRCQTCSACNGAHEYIASVCTNTADTVCASCSAIRCNSSDLVITAGACVYG